LSGNSGLIEKPRKLQVSPERKLVACGVFI
jgi:hypothetical protein